MSGMRNVSRGLVSRTKIIEIMEKGKNNIPEISEKAGLSQSCVGYHLNLLLKHKDFGEAVASVIILGIGLSITISAVASGSLFSLGSGACQEGTSGDCLLSAILVVWGLAAAIVGSAYVVFRIWRSPRIPRLRP